MDKERYSRSNRDRDSSVDHSPEREGGRRHRDGDSKRRSRREDREDERDRARDRGRSVEREGSRDREKHSHERSKRKDREEEDNGVREAKKKSRFSDGNGERRSRFEDEVTVGSGAINTTSGVPIGASSYTSSPSETSLAPRQALLTKVSSISTTDENKGVSIVRSHEVPGKSSTDGRSAGKTSSNLSLDALEKAKKVLLMKKGLEERMKNLPPLSKGTKPTPDGSLHTRVASSSTTTSVSAQPPSGLIGLGSISNIEVVKRAQALAASYGFRQDPEFAPLINFFPGQAPTETAVAQKPTKTPVLRVDALGREIDEHGNVISVTKPSNLSTLKVNINKQKKDAFQILKPQLEVDPEQNPHFDPRMGIDKNKILRPKRMNFLFVEEGKWTRDAENLKFKSQFGEAKARELKVKQAHLAKAKDDINPNLIEVSERVPRKEKPKEPIPDVEWWDANVLVKGLYEDIGDDTTTVTDSHLIEKKLTHYIEHPRPIEPPAEAAPPPPQPLKLTKREQKKLRTQRRLAKEKEKQEMIRQGLLEPPKAKVKMSNLMKVLGSEATQDPTKLEKEIRTAAAEREQAHTDRNAARKLTPAEKREKKERKLFDDPTTVETIVSVYKINKLSHPKTRFKVEMNARENRLTGCSVMTEGMSVVVVEGKSKAIKRYGKLMLRRINWEEAVKEEDKEDEEDEDEEEKQGGNKCWLVWQGSVGKPSFHRFHVQECLTESAARKLFSDAGVAHYWDLALNYSDD